MYICHVENVRSGQGGAFMPWKLSKSAILVEFESEAYDQVIPNPF